MSRAGAGRPNVLVLMADQMRYDAIGAHGPGALRTPNLDRLVGQGVSLRRAYSESPVCVSARAAVLTGRLPHRSGVFDNNTPLEADALTFPRLLSTAGYATAAIGKMHFAPTRAGHGLERLWLSEEIPDSPEDDQFLRDLLGAGFSHVEEPHGARHELYYVPQVSPLPEHLHTTAWTGRKTVEFLESRAGQAAPFFCWTSFIKPHPPFDPPTPWSRLYDPLEMPDPVRHSRERGWDTFWTRAQHRFKWTRPDYELERVRMIRAYYHASVAFVDHWVGEIISAAERLGLRENTLIVFVADHGEYLGDHGAYGKRGFHDAAARVPLVMSWPAGLPAGTESHALVGLADLGPTVLEAAGLAPEALDPDGLSLLALARGEAASVRQHLTGQFQHRELGLYMATDGRHKYVYSAPDRLEILLDCSSPAAETENLAHEPHLAGTREGLKRVILERLARDGYGEAGDGNGWRHYPRPPQPTVGDDREVGGRGRQYAVWKRRSQDS